ncbi:HAMP domain-containing protein [Leucothrix sargassi]|nr:HAMP domain-containing protein [Leucothrix sargassi]
MWKNFNFSLKMLVLVSVMLFFTILVGAGYHKLTTEIRDIGIQSAGDEMLSGYKNDLKNIVEVMASTLAAATEGMEDPEEIYQTYAKLTKDARFFPDQSGYFFIYRDGVNFVHAIKPELEGKDLTELKDAKGVLLIQELDKAAKSGGGYVEYYWDKPGKGNQPKLSYIQMIPNSVYSIGTGVYIDDIEEKEAEIFANINDYTKQFLTKWLVILLAGFFVIVLPLIVFMTKSMTSPLVRLTDVAAEYSRGALDAEIEYTDRKDEIGALSRAIKRLGSSTRILMKKLEDANDNK